LPDTLKTTSLMKKISGLIAAIALLPAICMSQENKKDHTQTPTFGVHFFFDDFESAAAIRASSLSSALRNKTFGKIKEMSPGLALNYIHGLSPSFDFTAMLAGSFLDYPSQEGGLLGENSLLLELDASVRGKMFSNKYWVSPYVQLGVGMSKFKGYWGAFMPVGVGMQLNLFDEAFLMINSQYRVPITDGTANYHFFHSIGLAGIIGKKK
jgi:OmpA-OmpF porin, OOP family